MRASTNLAGWPRSNRRLWLQSLLLLWAVRLGLWILPFRMVCRLVARAGRPRAGREMRPRSDVARIGRAVEISARSVPAATCLAQALVAHALLSRRGHASQVRIGVAKDALGKLEAHAWTESNGAIVVGGSVDLSRLAAMPPLDLT